MVLSQVCQFERGLCSELKASATSYDAACTAIGKYESCLLHQTQIGKASIQDFVDDEQHRHPAASELADVDELPEEMELEPS